MFKDLLVALVLTIVGFYLHHPWMNEFPAHIHAWAQTDRYAIALGFLNNGFNFFKPETFVYNHQFPNDWLLPGPATITSVDFPIHEYIIAILMKATGNESPIVFRFYTLVYSLIGLFFLYKTAYFLSKDFFKSLLVMFFAWFSPLLIYYQNGFLPTVPSLANLFIGLYWYVRHLKHEKIKYFYWAIVFFTLAALNRTTYLIPLLALIGTEFLKVLLDKKSFKPWLRASAISLLSIASNIAYNNFLRNQYGSEFLNHLMPAGNLAEAKELFWHVKARWKYIYFSWVQYEIYAAVIAAGIISFLIKFKTNLYKKPELTILFLSGVCMIGALLFSMAMTRQFNHHDYYFLDTYYFPVVISLFSASALIPGSQHRPVNAFWFLICSLVLYPMITEARNTQHHRRKPELWDRSHITVEAFKDADKFLQLHGVDKNARLLIPDAIAPNLAFILARRKGFCVMEPNRHTLNIAMNWDFDYMLAEREFFPSQVYSHYPEIIEKVSLVARNERLLLFKKTTPKQWMSIDKLAKFDEKNAILQAKSDFSSHPGQSWENIKLDTNIYLSPPSSAFVDQEMEFGLTYRFDVADTLINSVEWIYFSAHFLAEEPREADMVLSVNRDDSLIFYRRTRLQDLIYLNDGWKQIAHAYRVGVLQTGDKISFCIWNLGRGKYYYDDAVFRVFLKQN